MAGGGQITDKIPPDIHYSCHSEIKVCSAVVCIICEKVYHKSCFARKERINFLSSIFVICDKHASTNLTSTDYTCNDKAIILKLKEEISKLQTDLNVLNDKYQKLKTTSNLYKQSLDDYNNESLSKKKDEANLDMNVNKITQLTSENKGLVKLNEQMNLRISDLNELNSELKENNKLLKDKIEHQQNASNTQTHTHMLNYSQVASNTSLLPTYFQRKNVPAIVVNYKSETDKCHSNVVNKIKQNKKIQVNKCFKTKNKTIIKGETEQDNEELLKIISAITDIDLEVKVDTLKNPRLRICGIDTDISVLESEDIVEDLKLRNKLLENHFVSVKAKYKNRKNGSWNLIVEVNQDTYSYMMLTKKVYFGSNRCKIYDDFNLNICKQCCRYGHSSKNCRNKENTKCIYCAGSHLFSECQQRDKKQCTNCLSYNQKHQHKRDFQHSAVDFQACETYNYLLQINIRSTDYPYHPLVQDVKGSRLSTTKK